MHLPILYQDQDLVVISKPSGLLVHRSMIDKNETQFAMQLLRDQLGQFVYPVHRLDRPTSGALIFALSSDVARKLSVAFAERNVKKTYLAVVRGIAPREITVNYSLREELDSVSDPLARVHKPAQEAITHLKSLATVDLPFCVDRYPTSRYSLVRAEPVTGRKHQIRRHLRHLGHPIIGDITHGVGKHNRFFNEHFKIRRLLLVCTEVAFCHPTSLQKIKVRAPLSDDFQNLITILGWNGALNE
jgi:tRNA pseudouridine65 synthase